MQSMQDRWTDKLEQLYRAAIDAASPATVLPENLPDWPASEPVTVLALGKSAAWMAEIVENCWPDHELKGLAVCQEGYERPLSKIDLLAASHPVPGQSSLQAGTRLLDLAASVPSDGKLLVLLGGGGSALAAAPVPGLSLDWKQRITMQLLASGATISEINCVRRHLSLLKGGGLVQVCQGESRTLAFSDVVGNWAEDIASGPMSIDPSTTTDAARIAGRYNVDLAGLSLLETLKQLDTDRHRYSVVASGGTGLAAAAELARSWGWTVHDGGDLRTGEAFVEGRRDAASLPVNDGDAPLLFLSGGELTVTVEDAEGVGLGGPASEYLLGVISGLDGRDDVSGFAADTDGKDGNGAAGAYFSPETLIKSAGCDLDHYIRRHDAIGFMKKHGGVVASFSSPVNINDFRAILVLPEVTKD